MTNHTVLIARQEVLKNGWIAYFAANGAILGVRQDTLGASRHKDQRQWWKRITG